MLRTLPRIFLVLFSGASAVAGFAQSVTWQEALPATMPDPADNVSSAAKIAPGEALYFDPRPLAGLAWRLRA